MQTALHLPLQPPYRSTISALTTTTTQTTTPQLSRKRRRANQSPLSVTWNEIREVGKDGRERDVIVIEDTPPPTTVHSPTASLASVSYTNGSTYIPPIRTRAQAAAAAINTAAAYSVAGPSNMKKRKREAYDEPGPSSAGTYAKRTVAQNPAALKFDQHTDGTLANRTEDVCFVGYR
jgi:dual-specificity kinase